MNKEELTKEQIYIKYHDKIVKYFSYNLNDEIKAEDLSQDVFVKIYEKLDSFDSSKSSISTWIYTISHNLLIDYYRSNKVDLEYIDEIYSEENDTDFANDIELEKLAKAIEKLSSKEKQIIVGHYYDNLSLKEIAKDMNISYIYAKVLHAKALNKLKEIL